MLTFPYDRVRAVTYAHQWAYRRNPRYYDYQDIGGDCTNFASQCLYAGSGVMNFTPTFGWYYRNANDKAPAWSGVEYFRNFLVREEENEGPFGREAPMAEIKPGDFVQLNLGYGRFSHTSIVVAVGRRPNPQNILVATHSMDSDYRPLRSYSYEKVRFIHILGVRSLI